MGLDPRCTIFLNRPVSICIFRQQSLVHFFALVSQTTYSGEIADEGTNFRHGVSARLKDKSSVSKHVNKSVDFLAHRLANGHSIYGKDDHRRTSPDLPG